MLGLTTRPIPANLLRGRALAFSGKRRLLNLTVTEYVHKLGRALGFGSPHFLKKTHWDYDIQPWINKKGKTSEMFVFPPGSKIKDKTARWRVSMARVDSNDDFSLKQGYKQLITTVDGNGFLLTSGGETIAVRKGDIREISGDELVKCALIKGPCLDLNVIYQPDKVKVRLELEAFYDLDPVERVTASTKQDEIVIVVCLGGRGLVSSGMDSILLRQHESVRMSFSKEGEFTIAKRQYLSRFAVIRFVEAKT